MEIKGFKDEFHFLSNFHYAAFAWKGKLWKTSEHAYQAAKTLIPVEQEHIARLNKPGEAKRAGKTVTMRPDWNEVKISIMKEIVRAKFKQNQILLEKLLATDGCYLEETNYHKDTFWGVCDNVGKNHLGKILMELREEFKASLA